MYINIYDQVTSSNQRYGQVIVFINNNNSYNSTVNHEAITSIIHSGSGTGNYDIATFDRIIDITDVNAVLEFKVHSETSNASLHESRCNFMIEDMTPSAVPSINIPLPVAANAGQQLTVNQSGTGLEYNS